MTDTANGGDSKPTTFTQADLDKARESERAHAQKFQQERDELASRYKDLDPEKARAALKELDELRKKAAVGDPQKFEEELARREAAVRESVQKDIDEKENAIKTLSSRLKEHQVTDKVFAKAASRFNPDVLDDVRAYIRRDCDLDQDGNIIVKGADGKPRYSHGSTTKFMTEDEYVEELAKTKPSWAVSSAVAGGKQPGQKVHTHGGAQIHTLADAAKLPDKGKQFFKENPDAAQALLAGKTI